MPSSPPWHEARIGAGRVERRESQIQLCIPPSTAAQYHDAQVTDYAMHKPVFHNRPPLRLQLQARASGEIRGTAGFGFWNQFLAPGRRRVRPPQALWFFFGSPPNNIALARGVAGKGWKAATINARRWQFCALLPLAPLAFPLMRSKLFYDAFWHIGQRAIGVSEAPLDTDMLSDFHSYAIEWRQDRALFSVDGEVVLRAPTDIQQPLGFIAWVDNQYAIATPGGKFGFGKLDLPRTQSLCLRDIVISRWG